MTYFATRSTDAPSRPLNPCDTFPRTHAIARRSRATRPNERVERILRARITDRASSARTSSRAQTASRARVEGAASDVDSNRKSHAVREARRDVTRRDETPGRSRSRGAERLLGERQRRRLRRERAGGELQLCVRRPRVLHVCAFYERDDDRGRETRGLSCCPSFFIFDPRLERALTNGSVSPRA